MMGGIGAGRTVIAGVCSVVIGTRTPVTGSRLGMAGVGATMVRTIRTGAIGARLGMGVGAGGSAIGRVTSRPAIVGTCPPGPRLFELAPPGLWVFRRRAAPGRYCVALGLRAPGLRAPRVPSLLERKLLAVHWPPIALR